MGKKIIILAFDNQKPVIDNYLFRWAMILFFYNAVPASFKYKDNKRQTNPGGKNNVHTDHTVHFYRLVLQNYNKMTKYQQA